MKFCVTAIYHFDGWVRVGLPWDVVGVGRGGLGAVAHIDDTSKICGGIGWGLGLASWRTFTIHQKSMGGLGRG